VNRRKLLQVVAGLAVTGPVIVRTARPELGPGKLAIVLGPDSSGQTSWLLRWAGRLLSRSGRNVVAGVNYFFRPANLIVAGQCSVLERSGSAMATSAEDGGGR
jgi:hypothetical protein